MLGHGHGPGTGVAGDGNSSLCHGVAGAIGDVSPDNDFRPGVQPTYIVGGGTHAVDGRIGKSHGPQTLPRRTSHTNAYGLTARLPETPPNSVLPLGDHFDVLMTFTDSLMNPFFQNTRFKPREVFHPRDNYGRFVRHGCTLYFLQYIS